jgi:hypothetical protein
MRKKSDKQKEEILKKLKLDLKAENMQLTFNEIINKIL